MEVLGPGIWFSLKALAELFYNDSEIFLKAAVGIFCKITCGECSRDSLLYINKNYPHDPILWTCEFHNYINKKIGKPNYNCKFCKPAPSISNYSHYQQQ